MNSRFPRAFKGSVLKVSYSGKPLSPRQTGTFGHLKIGIASLIKDTGEGIFLP